jgi:hypothetical protein
MDIIFKMKAKRLDARRQGGQSRAKDEEPFECDATRLEQALSGTTSLASRAAV